MVRGGESELLKQRLSRDKAFVVNLLDPELANELSAYPNRLLPLIAAQSKPWIVIDEVQKAPALLQIVHHQIGEKTSSLHSQVPAPES